MGPPDCQYHCNGTAIQLPVKPPEPRGPAPVVPSGARPLRVRSEARHGLAKGDADGNTKRLAIAPTTTNSTIAQRMTTTV
jgi:hypothetical protein